MEKIELIKRLRELLKAIKYDVPENFYDGEKDEEESFVADHQFHIIEDADMSKYTSFRAGGRAMALPPALKEVYLDISASSIM